jgi:hypothetical protein
VDAIADALSRVMPEPRHVEVAATADAGLDPWLVWLEEASAERSRATAKAP